METPDQILANIIGGIKEYNLDTDTDKFLLSLENEPQQISLHRAQQLIYQGKETAEKLMDAVYIQKAVMAKAGYVPIYNEEEWQQYEEATSYFIDEDWELRKGRSNEFDGYLTFIHYTLITA